MDTLTRLMREAAELAPDGLDAAGADHVNEVWRRGRRRRLVRGTATAAGSLAVLAVVVSLVLGTSNVVPDQVLPADGGRGTGVTSYPQRIGHQLVVTDLPSRPGPMAAVIRQGSDGDGWQVVSSTGRRHRLPQASDNWSDLYPVLSSDGRRLAYYQDEVDQIVVKDLVTGATWPVDIGRPDSSGPNGSFHTARAHQLAQQHPGWFSPSDRYLALATFDGPVVSDLDSDETWLVPSMQQAAGWLDDDRLVGRTWSDDETSGRAFSERDIKIVMWDRRTGTTSQLGSVDLTTATAASVSTRGQWWGSVRQDRTLWLATNQEDGAVDWMTGVSLPELAPVTLTGARVSSTEWTSLRPFDGAVSWRASVPVGLMSYGDWQVVEPLDMVRESTTAVDPHLEVPSLMWAADALNGEPSRTLSGVVFGTSNAWWAWWWKEIALVIAGVGLLVWWRRRRRGSVAE